MMTSEPDAIEASIQVDLYTTAGFIRGRNYLSEITQCGYAGKIDHILGSWSSSKITNRDIHTIAKYKAVVARSAIERIVVARGYQNVIACTTVKVIIVCATIENIIAIRTTQVIVSRTSG